MKQTSRRNLRGKWMSFKETRGFYTGNNTNFLTTLLENLGVFLLVKFYSVSLHSLSAQVSIKGGNVVLLHYSILRAKSGCPVLWEQQS